MWDCPECGCQAIAESLTACPACGRSREVARDAIGGAARAAQEAAEVEEAEAAAKAVQEPPEPAKERKSGK